MKLLPSIMMASAMTLVLPACAKEEPKKETAAEFKKDPTLGGEPVYKTVCMNVQGKDGKPVMDPKTNKPRQNCVKVRVREKFEGTKIPDGKK